MNERKRADFEEVRTFFLRRLHVVAHACNGHFHVAERLGLGLLAAGHVGHQLQELVAHLGEISAVDDGEASTSMLSSMLAKVMRLPVILMTGAMGLPVGVPRPVEKTTTWAPPATMAATEEGSLPGVSITTRPLLGATCLA